MAKKAKRYKRKTFYKLGNNRNKSLIGLVILKGFTYQNNEWKNGTIYDPTNGKIYKCTMRLNDYKALKLRGYWRIFYQTQKYNEMVFLLVAIGLEICGTLMLKFSYGGQKIGFSVASLLFYCSSLWCLSITLKYMEMNIAYAIWSGLGLTLLTIIQILFFKEPVTLPKILFSILIIVGVMGLNFTSKH